MDTLQKILKSIYPLRMKFSSATGLGKKSSTNTVMKTPTVSFYNLNAKFNSGKDFNFETLKGKYVLIANTASNCGYTGQYDDLEKLYQQHKDNLIVLGFPANDFGGQEPGSDDQIAEFCKINYGVTFPIFEKNSVKGNEMQPVFQWLSQSDKNGWCSQVPTWNFCKYLINPEGVLLDFYSSAVSPLGKDIVNRLQ